VERTYRVRYDDDTAISLRRNELITIKDSNCPAEWRKRLLKRRAEKELLAQMNVPIKRERRTLDGLSDESPNKLNGVQTNGVQTNGSIQIKQEIDTMDY
jgi:hypothetical protein